MHKYKIGITGGIGSGKSTVSDILRENGYPVFSCDDINRQLLNDPLYIARLQELFPSAIINGKLDKCALAKIVFADKEQLKKLNDLAHPRIMEKLWQSIEEANGNIVFAEVQLLFEEHLENCFDTVWIIVRSNENRLKAVMRRDNSDRENVLARMRQQIDYNEAFLKEHQKSNIKLIFNNGSIEELTKEVLLNLKISEESSL